MNIKSIAWFLNNIFYEPNCIAAIELYLHRTLVQYNFKQLLSKRRFYHRVTQSKEAQSNTEKTLYYSVKKLSATLWLKQLLNVPNVQVCDAMMLP